MSEDPLKSNPLATKQGRSNRSANAPAGTPDDAEPTSDVGRPFVSGLTLQTEPGTIPVPPGTDPADPTKEGIWRDLTPLDTRSSGDTDSGREDADKMISAQDSGERNRVAGARDGGATIDVPDGTDTVPDLDLEGMSDAQAKVLLASYGVDATLSDAKRVLEHTLNLGKQ